MATIRRSRGPPRKSPMRAAGGRLVRPARDPEPSSGSRGSTWKRALREASSGAGAVPEIVLFSWQLRKYADRRINLR